MISNKKISINQIDSSSLTPIAVFNAFTSSYSTGSFTGSFVGSLQGTSSYALNGLSASYALSSSFSENSISSSYALTASYLDNYVPPFPFTGSAEITGSLIVTGSITATSFTGSLEGTSSYASNSTSASYALSSSFSENSISSSYALTASYTTAISGTDNYVPKFNGTSALEDSLIYDNGTNIGIGTISPGSKLHVNGTFIAGASTTSGLFYNTANDTLNISNIRALEKSGASLYLGNTNTTLIFRNNSFERMRITSTGNIGIGTTVPSASLHIQGSGNTSGSLSLQVTNSDGTGSFRIYDNGNISNPGFNTALDNEAFGKNALESLDSTQPGFGATMAIGPYALRRATQSRINIAMGYAAMAYTSGSTVTGSIAIGPFALGYQQGGEYNIALGYNALRGSSTIFNTGDRNLAIGAGALQNNTTGTRNNAVGDTSLSSNTVGSYNTTNGNRALRTNTSGSYNSAFGLDSLYYQTSASFNTGLGAQSGVDITTGDSNTLVGYNAGRGLTTGRANTLVGANIAGLSPTLSNTIILADGDGNQKFTINSANEANLTGSLTATSFTGSLFGTASWAENSTTASYIETSLFTSGSVLFSNGTTIAQNNSNLFWDNTNSKLGIGISTPSSKLDVITTSDRYAIRVGENTQNFDGSWTGIKFHLSTNTSNSETTDGTVSLRAYRYGTGNKLEIRNSSNIVATFGGVSNGLLLGTTVDNGVDKLQVNGSTSINGNTNITGRAFISSSTGTVSGSSLTVYGSGSTQPVFTVQGSQGELFSITDSLSGSLFSVNDISGLPILEVFSDNTTLIGNYQDPMLITTAKNVLTNSGSFTIYSLPTASYDTAFFEYSIRSGSNARAGQIMAIQDGANVNYTETTTTDFGSTSGVSLGVFISGSNMVLTGSADTTAWTIKTIIRSI